MRQAIPAARRAAQLLALLLAVLTGSPALAQQHDRAAGAAVMNAAIGLELGRSEAPGDLRLGQAEDPEADGDKGWDDEPSAVPTSVAAPFASRYVGSIAPAADPVRGRSTRGYRARAPPRR